MTGGLVVLITWRGQDVALVQMTEPVTVAMAADWSDMWTRGTEAGVVLIPGGWTVQDDRTPRP